MRILSDYYADGIAAAKTLVIPNSQLEDISAGNDVSEL